jgi:hypothetical protein
MNNHEHDNQNIYKHQNHQSKTNKKMIMVILMTMIILMMLAGQCQHTRLQFWLSLALGGYVYGHSGATNTYKDNIEFEYHSNDQKKHKNFGYFGTEPKQSSNTKGQFLKSKLQDFWMDFFVVYQN